MGISDKVEKVMRIVTIVLLLAIALLCAIFEPLKGANVVNAPSPMRADWENQKQDKITFSTRAPRANDGGGIWIEYTENSDTTIYIHVRHPITGTWRKATAS